MRRRVDHTVTGPGTRGKVDTVSAESVRWLSVPEVAEAIGESVSRVRRMIDDHHLVATRRDGIVVVPDLLLRDGGVLPEIRGTVIVLLDAGFTTDEALDWLLEPESSLGCAPIDALRAGRKAEVRRVAQAVA